MKIRPALLVLLFMAAPGVAQLNRTAVSVNGSDTNSCAVASPCRTFAVAIAATNPGGEVIALDSGGFGMVTVGKSVSLIAAPGVYAGITATGGSGAYAILVEAASNSKVVIRGITINSLGGTHGIYISSAGSVSVEKFTMDGGGWAIGQSVGNLSVSDAVIRDCYNGIISNLLTPGPKTTIDRVTVVNATNVAFSAANGGHITVRDSVATGGNVGFNAGGTVASTVMNLENCVASHLFIGVDALDNGTTRISNSVVTANGNGVWEFGTGVVETFGNNEVRGNGVDVNGGTPTTVSQN